MNTPFEKQIYEKFELEPTEQQKKAIFLLSGFIEKFARYSVFVLAGYAGTGKTTLLSALVRSLKEAGVQYRLMASTGRAAKVMGRYSGENATTIHKRIYRRRSSVGGSGNFDLNFNKDRSTVYIVDEVSMISDIVVEKSFGSGNLLSDFFDFVNSSDDNIVVFVGDSAQLPPVGCDVSPALSPSVLKRYADDVSAVVLTEVVRQAADSRILMAATDIRYNIDSGVMAVPYFHIGPELNRVDGRDLVDSLQTSYGRSSVEQTVVITRSNYRAVKYNLGIRQQVRCLEEELCPSDMLMVVKNNYFLAEKDPDAPFDFIANGDTVIVDRVFGYEERYGLRFARVSYYFPDYDEYPMESLVIVNTLSSTSASLSEEESAVLFDAVAQDYAQQGFSGTKLKQKVMDDVYFNALQVKYAYAVTCHKAQGGQWEEVYLDNVFSGNLEIDLSFMRWLYTAVTRARKKLYFVNWPLDYFIDE